MTHYTDYLASTSYRPYLQPTPGLGSSARTGLAIWVGGPRAGAGSAVRIYNFYSSLGLLNNVWYNPQLQKIRQRGQLWNLNRGGLAVGYAGLNSITF